MGRAWKFGTVRGGRDGGEGVNENTFVYRASCRRRRTSGGPFLSTLAPIPIPSHPLFSLSTTATNHDHNITISPFLASVRGASLLPAPPGACAGPPCCARKHTQLRARRDNIPRPVSAADPLKNAPPPPPSVSVRSRPLQAGSVSSSRGIERQSDYDEGTRGQSGERRREQGNRERNFFYALFVTQDSTCRQCSQMPREVRRLCRKHLEILQPSAATLQTCQLGRFYCCRLADHRRRPCRQEGLAGEQRLGCGQCRELRTAPLQD